MAAFFSWLFSLQLDSRFLPLHFSGTKYMPVSQHYDKSLIAPCPLTSLIDVRVKFIRPAWLLLLGFAFFTVIPDAFFPELSFFSLASSLSSASLLSRLHLAPSTWLLPLPVDSHFLPYSVSPRGAYLGLHMIAAKTSFFGIPALTKYSLALFSFPFRRPLSVLSLFYFLQILWDQWIPTGYCDGPLMYYYFFYKPFNLGLSSCINYS